MTPVPYTHRVPPAASPTSGIQNKPLTQTTAQEEAEPLQALVAKESVSQQHFRAEPRLLNVHPCVGRLSWWNFMRRFQICLGAEIFFFLLCKQLGTPSACKQTLQPLQPHSLWRTFSSKLPHILWKLDFSLTISKERRKKLLYAIRTLARNTKSLNELLLNLSLSLTFCFCCSKALL